MKFAQAEEPFEVTLCNLTGSDKSDAKCHDVSLAD